MTKGSHEYLDDPRNAEILVYVNGDLVPRAEVGRGMGRVADDP